MKAHTGVPAHISYRLPYIPKRTYKVLIQSDLSFKAKQKLKALNLYQDKKCSIDQICEIFDISRATFYRWRKSYNPRSVQSLEDRKKRPKTFRPRTIRLHENEKAVCDIRRKYPYFGKEKIKRILERDHGINISVSSVGRILFSYKDILPRTKVQKKRAKSIAKSKVRLKDVHKDIKGRVSELIQADTIELNLKFQKTFIFSAVDPVSKLLYMKAYRRRNSLNASDFLKRLHLVHDRQIKYIQIDNGSEFAMHFKKGADHSNITLIHNYPRSPKMNCFVEKVNDTIQVEYLDRFYEETRLGPINDILLDCMLEYNFYRPHRSLDLLTPIEYIHRQSVSHENDALFHMYRTHSFY